MNISTKSRAATFLFAFFFGLLGIHRFYVGKVGTGVVMLLLTLSFIGMVVSGVWAFIDWIVVGTGHFKDIDGKFVKTW
jgi:TM2 domain-containing membrane protein YozV